MAHAHELTSAGGGTAGAQTGVLLFYRVSTGLATTGSIDTAGNYTDLRNHNFDPRWARVFPLGNGLVLFNKGPEAGGTLLAGRFHPDGSYHDLKVYRSFGFIHHLVAVSDNVVLAYDSPRDARIARVDADGTYAPLRSYDGFDSWTHTMSMHDGLVLFYNQITRRAATIRVHSDGSYQDLNTYSGFDIWTHIIATSNGVLLFYNEFTGAAATGRIDANGNYADLGNHRFDRYWRYVVPSIDGHVLFFSGVTGAGALLGRIDANGVYTDGPVVNGGFDPWSYIGSVI